MTPTSMDVRSSAACFNYLWDYSPVIRKVKTRREGKINFFIISINDCFKHQLVAQYNWRMYIAHISNLRKPFWSRTRKRRQAASAQHGSTVVQSHRAPSIHIHISSCNNIGKKTITVKTVRNVNEDDYRDLWRWTRKKAGGMYWGIWTNELVAMVVRFLLTTVDLTGCINVYLEVCRCSTTNELI